MLALPLPFPLPTDSEDGFDHRARVNRLGIEPDRPEQQLSHVRVQVGLHGGDVPAGAGQDNSLDGLAARALEQHVRHSSEMPMPLLANPVMPIVFTDSRRAGHASAGPLAAHDARTVKPGAPGGVL